MCVKFFIMTKSPCICILCQINFVTPQEIGWLKVYRHLSIWGMVKYSGSTTLEYFKYPTLGTDSLSTVQRVHRAPNILLFYLARNLEGEVVLQLSSIPKDGLDLSRTS
jgi:hypothetical protein